jgi:hypothetical protein
MPYSVEIPATAAAAGAGAINATDSSDQNDCRTQTRGRSGQQYQCGAEPTPTPRR